MGRFRMDDSFRGRSISGPPKGASYGGELYLGTEPRTTPR